MGGRIAVLFCDVDHFKQVNDTLGHAAGDRLLVVIARGIKAAVRAEDTVGRIGGDEFVVIAYPVYGRSEAESLAERVMKQAGQAANLDGGKVPPSLSIGVALSAPGDSPDTLLAAADQALYRAKTAGRSQWELADDR
jgi:diguanylate cyclase (GGDEF)-like protein